MKKTLILVFISTLALWLASGYVDFPEKLELMETALPQLGMITETQILYPISGFSRLDRSFEKI